jgi:hypothetical protein
MQRRVLRIALASVAGATCIGGAAAAVSCSSGGAPAAAGGPLKGIQPSITLQGAGLAEMSKVLTLAVYAGGTNDAGLLCNPNTGRLYDTLGDAGVAPLVASKMATSSGCGTGYDRCFTTGINVPDSNTSPRVFSVIGYADAAQTMPIAYGCTSTMLDVDAQATATVNITLFPASTCGMAPYTLQPPQTCNEPPSDSGTPPICSATCQTPEELLSVGTGNVDGGSKTMTGTAGQKSNPSFVWPAGGQDFVAVFGDTATTAGTSQISVRFLSDALTPTLFGAFDPAARSNSIFLPNTTGISPVPSPVPGNQKQPAAVETGGTIYVVFADDSASPGTFAIHLRSFDSTLEAQQNVACPISDASDASPTSYENPVIAFTTLSSGVVMLIGWQDGNGNVYVRAYSPNTSGGCGTTGAQITLGKTNASQISLAGITSGGGSFIAVWKSGSDVVTQGVAASGAPAGTTPTQVSLTGHTASNPSVASIPSGQDVAPTNVGAFALVWSDLAPNAASNATTIYALRFDNGGIGRDAPSQISVSSNGGEITPMITGSPTGTGSYVVTWVDNQSPSQVRARYLNATSGHLDAPTTGASPYIQNPFDGTTGEFPVGLASGRTRVTPTVVVGGGNTSMASYSNQAYTAFGWVDNTSGSGAGIIARRWPSPQQFQQ